VIFTFSEGFAVGALVFWWQFFSSKSIIEITIKIDIFLSYFLPKSFVRPIIFYIRLLNN
jgi:hypothetical protein